MLKSFLKIGVVIFLVLFLSKNVFAQRAAADQYKQMGGIVGLTEVCLKLQI